jgi:hypothetical protein
MPNDRPASKAGNYCITAIDKAHGASAVAAGMTFRQAIELRQKMARRWSDITFIVEPDDTHLTIEPSVYQIVGVNEDRSRTILMNGMTLDQAEAARDALLPIAAFIWIWIEREPIATGAKL